MAHVQQPRHPATDLTNVQGNLEELAAQLAKAHVSESTQMDPALRGAVTKAREEQQLEQTQSFSFAGAIGAILAKTDEPARSEHTQAELPVATARQRFEAQQVAIARQEAAPHQRSPEELKVVSHKDLGNLSPTAPAGQVGSFVHRSAQQSGPQGAGM